MIFKHHRHETKQVMQEEIPQRYQHLLIPHATQYYVEGLFGSIISQEIREKDFTVWQHHFFIEEPCTILAFNDTPVISNNFMMQGTPYAKLPGFRTSLLEENKYRLFFVPVAEHPVAFVEGSYKSIHIDYDPDKVKGATNGNLRLMNLLNYIVQDGKKIQSYLSGPVDEQIEINLTDILWYTGPNRPKYVKQLAYRLLLNYALKHHSMKDDISVVEKYIATNLSGKIPVDNLIKYCTKSRSEFFRLFKIQYGKTPCEYIQEQRLIRGRKLVESTPMSLLEIAVLTGFDSLSHFSRAFKDFFGITPSDCR